MNLLNTRHRKICIYFNCKLRLEVEYVTMAGQSSAMFGWSWTEVSVLCSQVFGRALMESCAVPAMLAVYSLIVSADFINFELLL